MLGREGLQKRKVTIDNIWVTSGDDLNGCSRGILNMELERLLFLCLFEGCSGVCMGVVLGLEGMGRDAPVCACFRGLGSIKCSW